MIPFLAFPRGRSGSTACVATVHDVIPMVFPHHAPRSRKSRLYPVYRRLMIEVGRRADVILTDSRASRADVVRYLRIAPEAEAKVRTVYCGVADRFRPAESPPTPAVGDDEVRTVLYVGRIDPYKNLGTLIRAFARLRKTFPSPVRLRIAGPPDARYAEPAELIRSLGLQDAAEWMGYLSDEELVRCYRTADVLVHPSRYEGFGLQVAEAMACGLPVVCSNASSLPEVAGGAAVMVDPDDVDGFARAVAGILSDPSRAESLSEKGRRRAARFTWERCARETLAAYEEADAMRASVVFDKSA
jgi:glycosyltransferase involved in cell wall biosynthesis